jgi:nitric oxide reductase subunit B
MVPDESRTELYSVKLAYVQLVLWTLMGVTAVIGYLFRYGTGNKLLEQPLPHKIVIVICMLLFLYNIGMTIWKSRRFTTTEGVLVLGLGLAAVLYLPALLEFENYTVAIFYRWWTIHLWVEGVWEMIQGGFLAYLLIRLSGADREVMEKWLYVIVGLVFIAGILGTAHHYYWVGVPSYWLPIGGIFSALEPAGTGGHGDLRLLGHAPLGHVAPQHAGAALDAGQRRVHALRRRPAGAGPHLSRRQQVDPRHADHRDAWPRRVLRCVRDDHAGDDQLRLPAMTPGRSEQGSSIGYWSFWLQIGGMFGMTLSFATAGIAQVYLERILGMGYLDAQLKIQVHFVMLVVTGSIFAIGVGLFIYDFFRHAPRFDVDDGQKPVVRPGLAPVVPSVGTTAAPSA